MLEAVSLDKFKSQSFEIKEVGTVVEVKKAVASIVGLPSCLFGQMVYFPNDLDGMVVGFDEKKVSVLVFGDVTNIKPGDQVIGKTEPFEVPVGNGFVGRISSQCLNTRVTNRCNHKRGPQCTNDQDQDDG